MFNTTSSLSSLNNSTATTDSKYTVAEILSSMNTSGLLTPTTLASGSSAPLFSTGIVTGTTPTLTPTTLNNIEQTFMDFQSGVATSSSGNSNINAFNFSQIRNTAPLLLPHQIVQPQDLSIHSQQQQQQHPQQSGFISPLGSIEQQQQINNIIPAMVQIKQEVDTFDDSSSADMDYFGGAAANSGDGFKRQRLDDDGKFVVPNIDPNTYLVANSRRPTGPRKIRRNEVLTPEETTKRQQRRERNKHAAAKCRQKREEITTQLINETEGLEEEKSNLENEIQTLLQQKEQLQFLLESHNASCNKHQHHHHNQQQQQQFSQGQFNVKIPSSTTMSQLGSYHQTQPLSQRTSTMTNVYNNVSTSNESNFVTSRPSTLPIINSNQHLTLQPMHSSSVVTESLGVPISTPSTGLGVFNFDTLMDGHTGLTPISGLTSTLIPTCTSYTCIPTCTTSYNTRTCATQHQRSTDSSSSNEVSSPTMISL